MESLAYLVMALVSILMLSGPINIGLTSQRVQRFTDTCGALKIGRRIFSATLGFIAVAIAIQFLYNDAPLEIKLFSIIAIAGNIYALKREVDFAKSK
jgi:hypothetical protein